MRWSETTLGEATEIVSGATPKSSIPDLWDGGVMWATPTDLSRLNSKSIEQTERTISEKGLQSCSARLLPPRSVLFSSRAPIGLVAINKVPMATNQGFKSFVPKPCLNPDYLYWWLKANREQLEDLGNGATFKEVSKSVVARVSLPLPPLNEQRRIASILDKADAIRRKREAAVLLADDLLKSVFLTQFGDPLVNPHGFRREAIALHLSRTKPGTQSGPFGSSLKRHEYVQDGIPVWGVENVQQGMFVDNPTLFISEQKFRDLKRYAVEHGDILISRAGTVGRMCIAKPSVSQSIISTNLVRVALNTESLLPEFFVALFTYVPHRVGALKANNKQDAFTFLNPKTLKALEIPVPDLPSQERFRQVVKKVEHQKSLMRDELMRSEQLFASLSQRAFRGEL